MIYFNPQSAPPNDDITALPTLSLMWAHLQSFYIRILIVYIRNCVESGFKVYIGIVHFWIIDLKRVRPQDVAPWFHNPESF